MNMMNVKNGKQNEGNDFLDIIKGGTCIKFLKEQLKDKIGNSIKDKFNEKNFSFKNEIEDVVSNTIGKLLSIKSNKKDINYLSKNITYGRDNISKSNLLQKYNIDIFAKESL